MNILYISISDIPQGQVSTPGIYKDLLRKFRDNGHEVYAVCAVEKRKWDKHRKYGLFQEDGINLVRIDVGNITKTNYIEKGISTVLLPGLFLKQIKNYLSGIHFDLILYATPPVTLYKTVRKIKTITGAKTFLMLKDMWPDGISCLGVIKENGLIYKYFKTQEKYMYEISDHIGCMSESCVDYMIKHFPYLNHEKLTICPNSLEPRELKLSSDEKINTRRQYGLPEDKLLIIYGGNLGRAQGIDFLIHGIERNRSNSKFAFVIIGSGLEYSKLKNYVEIEKPDNIFLFEALPREEYFRLMACCDIGLILLNCHLTVPNTPSRILDYMQAELPVFACVDKVTDVGKVIESHKFGWMCYSDDDNGFDMVIDKIAANKSKLAEYGKNGNNYFLKNYTSDISYQAIISCLSRADLV